MSDKNPDENDLTLPPDTNADTEQENTDPIGTEEEQPEQQERIENEEDGLKAVADILQNFLDSNQIGHKYNTTIRGDVFGGMHFIQQFAGNKDNDFLEFAFEDFTGLNEHFPCPAELKSKVTEFRKILLEQNVLIINSIDEEINETVCANLLADPVFIHAQKKAYYRSKGEDTVPNAIGPLIRLLGSKKNKEMEPLVLCYYERAESADTSLLLSLTGENHAHKGNTATLKSLNTYIIYVLQSSVRQRNPGKIRKTRPPFLWSLDFYPHLLHRYTQDSNFLRSMQAYYDWILEKNEDLRSNDLVFYEYFSEIQSLSHPESFYLTREPVSAKTEKTDPNEINSILDTPLYLAIIYIQCYLPSIPLREYDVILSILLPVASDISEFPYLQPLTAWKNSPDKILEKCRLIARKNEDGSVSLEFRSVLLREKIHALLEDKYAMSAEKFTQMLHGSLLLFSPTHSSQLHTRLIELFRTSLIREEKSARLTELLRWISVWDTALRVTDATGIAAQAKTIARLLAELMIENQLVPVVYDLLKRLVVDSSSHFFLLEILFTLSRWFEVVNVTWMRSMIDSEDDIISKKALRLIYHNIRGNNLSLAEVVRIYSGWLPQEEKENYIPSERFALGLFTELIDDTEIESSQWGYWPPKTSVLKECADNYRETISSVCKVILHTGVIAELRKHFEANTSLQKEAHDQAVILHRLGFKHPQEAYLYNSNERKKCMKVVAEIIFSWKTSELLVYWCMILQGKSSTRMHPKARAVRECLLKEVAVHSSEHFRKNLLMAWVLAEKIHYSQIITPIQVREIRTQFQLLLKNLPKTK